MQRWELVVQRREQQVNATGRCRTVGSYQVYHDGIAVDGLSGTTAEPPGPGDNTIRGKNRRCIEAGSYPLMTSDGPRYLTWGYREDPALRAGMPGLRLGETGDRTDILIHPGKNAFLSSTGCINLCVRLPDSRERINYAGSRRRVISLIDDLKGFVGAGFPPRNGQPIDCAWVTIEDASGVAETC